MKLQNILKVGTFDSRIDHTRVFLSYSTRDFAKVSEFKEMLIDRYPRLYVQEHPVQDTYDQNWKIDCDKKIKKSIAMICLVGQDTHSSTAVHWELLQAQNYGIPTLGVYLEVDPPYPPLPKGLDSVSTQTYEPISILDSMIK